MVKGVMSLQGNSIGTALKERVALPPLKSTSGCFQLAVRVFRVANQIYGILAHRSPKPLQRFCVEWEEWSWRWFLRTKSCSLQARMQLCSCGFSNPGVNKNTVVMMRQTYLMVATPQPDQFSVLVRGIPKPDVVGESYRNKVKKLFIEFHPVHYLSHQMLFHSTEWESLLTGLVYALATTV